MLDIITNPILVSVFVLIVLCLLRMHVWFAIIISAFVCGLLGGAGLTETMSMFVTGLSGDNDGTMTRLFMGIVAACMVASGLGDVLAPRVSRVLKGRPWVIIVGLTLVAIFCETIVTFGSTFCLILIPPLLSVFNHYKVDRRMAVTAIMAGLQIGYVCVPIGLGAVFQGIVADTMKANGVEGVTYLDVAAAAWPVGIAMVLAVVMVAVMYHKPREYKPVPGITAPVEGETAMAESVMPPWELKHTLAIVAALVAPVVQIITGDLKLGSMFAIILLCVFGVVKYKDLPSLANKGLLDMAVVTFIMAAGAGYANVSKTVGDVTGLVENTVALLGGSKLLGAFVMLLLGLVVTMGIGTSWGTVPIVAVIMVPMGLKMGFSIPAIIMMLCGAAALGDAGSPISDQTTIPTATFNIDGQHDHIWDTCVPSFICCNLPILVVCTIFATFM